MEDYRMTEEQTIKKTWSALWDQKQKESIDSWDSLSAIILATLDKECSSFPQSAHFIEAGCGTGRISRELQLKGREVTCLDIAPEALVLAEQQVGAEGHFILGSILDMPKGNNYDIVWNAGVMEHFSPTDQKKIIAEFGSVLKKDFGKIILFTPYSNSFLYRVGKYFLEKMNRWPFGVEVPVRTLCDVTPSSLFLEKEYTVAFLPLILDSYKWISFLRPLCRFFFSFFVSVLGLSFLRKIDRLTSSLFGGYLLVSVLSPKKHLL